MSKKLEGKVAVSAVITGGNSGIGLATARRFVAEGCRKSTGLCVSPLTRPLTVHLQGLVGS
jgi:NAD(P)-dependent dehydrogenase (short-subunit alcohol dehydrogenase family)